MMLGESSENQSASGHMRRQSHFHVRANPFSTCSVYNLCVGISTLFFCSDVIHKNSRPAHQNFSLYVESVLTSIIQLIHFYILHFGSTDLHRLLGVTCTSKRNTKEHCHRCFTRAKRKQHSCLCCKPHTWFLLLHLPTRALLP